MRKSKGNILLLVLGLFVVVILFSFVLADTALRSVQTVSRDYEHEQVYIITKDVLQGFIKKAKQDNSILKYIESKTCLLGNSITANTAIPDEANSEYSVEFLFSCDSSNPDENIIKVVATGYDNDRAISESISASFSREKKEGGGSIIDSGESEYAESVNTYIADMLDNYNTIHRTDYVFPSDAGVYTSYAKDILGWDMDNILSWFGLNGASTMLNSTFNGALYLNNQNFYIYNSQISEEVNFRYSTKGFRLYTKMSDGSKTSSVGSLSNVNNKYVCSTATTTTNNNDCTQLTLNDNSNVNKQFKEYLKFNETTDYQKTMTITLSEEQLAAVKEIALNHNLLNSEDEIITSDIIEKMFVRDPTFYWYSIPSEINNFYFNNPLWEDIDVNYDVLKDVPRIIDLYSNNKELVITRIINLYDDFNGIIYAPAMHLKVEGGTEGITINGQVAVCSFYFDNVEFNYVKFVTEDAVDDTYYFDGFQ